MGDWMEQQIELLQRLGKLAKLEVSEKDEKLNEDLSKIISYIDVIRAVDTTGIEPLSHMQSMENANGEQMSIESATSQRNPMEWNVFREDEFALDNVSLNKEDELTLNSICFHRNELLKNAPKTEQGYFVVPKTVTE